MDDSMVWPGTHVLQRYNPSGDGTSIRFRFTKHEAVANDPVAGDA